MANRVSGWCHLCRLFVYRGRGVWWRGAVYCRDCHLEEARRRGV
jgi:hypothetical protein